MSMDNRISTFPRQRRVHIFKSLKKVQEELCVIFGPLKVNIFCCPDNGIRSPIDAVSYTMRTEQSTSLSVHLSVVSVLFSGFGSFCDTVQCVSINKLLYSNETSVSFNTHACNIHIHMRMRE